MLSFVFNETPWRQQNLELVPIYRFNASHFALVKLHERETCFPVKRHRNINVTYINEDFATEYNNFSSHSNENINMYVSTERTGKYQFKFFVCERVFFWH